MLISYFYIISRRCRLLNYDYFVTHVLIHVPFYLPTDVMEVPLRIAQDRGIQCINYLDDWLLWAESEKTAREHGAVLVKTLVNLGFVLNMKKSILVPTQCLEWLGVDWDTRWVNCNSANSSCEVPHCTFE